MQLVLIESEPSITPLNFLILTFVKQKEFHEGSKALLIIVIKLLFIYYNYLLIR